jgi:hypothetical protein
MEHMFSVIQKMVSKAKAISSHFRNSSDPCEDAGYKINDKIREIGMPLRVLDRQKQHDSEVSRIKSNIKLPVGAFTFPKHYKVENHAQKQRVMEKQMKQNMPDENMMKQMQESGRIPPDAMEKLKNLQEMMKQYNK